MKSVKIGCAPLLTLMDYLKKFFLQIEQLSDQVGEEAVLLTASVTDGSSSHLGSQSGKVFAEDHAEIRSQFLGYCLKSELHHFRRFT